MKTGVTKREFIDKYSELLRMTRERVDYLELKDEDTVIIHYVDRERVTKVNIAMDSAMAIIRDVAKHI